ncbi:MAG: prepilin-type N-terminal cleavage/methylation domain-containing protein [Candidatus Roizmanbacteria bacterium]|nr:prepilin-type N-terminal cleavage/methylation domain-containing protein [Candidatus Roizmanbacteria bacterium]
MAVKQFQFGFTLIELIVVIGIIGVLATLGIGSYSNIQKNARITKSLSDLRDIRVALLQLELDSNKLPGGLPTNPCVQNPESNLNACTAGLLCNSGIFSNWNGPYIEGNLLDFWGRPYYFDPDYRCRTYVKGCESVANNAWVRVVQTFGNDGIQGYGDGDTRDTDNVVLILCK